MNFLGAVATDVGSYKEDQSENDTKVVKVKVNAISLDFTLNFFNVVDVLLVFLEERNILSHQSWLTEHDVVLRFTVHTGLIHVGGEDFHVPTTTVDLLLMLHSELDDKRFTLITKRVKATG